MIVKGLLVKYLRPHQRTGQSPRSKKVFQWRNPLSAEGARGRRAREGVRGLPPPPPEAFFYFEPFYVHFNVVFYVIGTIF